MAILCFMFAAVGGFVRRLSICIQARKDMKAHKK